MKKSAGVRLTIVAAVGIAAYGQNRPDPCGAGSFNETACQAAVQAKGGDLFVNSPQSSPPENPGFVLPRRKPGEHIVTFTERVQAAAEAVERGQR